MHNSHNMKSKTQGSPWAIQDPPIGKHLEPKMQALTEYENYYHMIIVDEKVK